MYKGLFKFLQTFHGFLSLSELMLYSRTVLKNSVCIGALDSRTCTNFWLLHSTCTYVGTCSDVVFLCFSGLLSLTDFISFLLWIRRRRRLVVFDDDQILALGSDSRETIRDQRCENLISGWSVTAINWDEIQPVERCCYPISQVISREAALLRKSESDFLTHGSPIDG